MLERNAMPANKSHPSALMRNLKLVLLALALSVLSGIISLILSNGSALFPETDVDKYVEKKRQEIINDYKSRYGDEWKDRMFADCKDYIGQ
jgi:hypothetical protein